MGLHLPRGGFCKQIVALLLRWINDPDQFEPRSPVSELLVGKSREDLVALIELMVERAPDLETLTGLPLPSAGPANTSPAVAPDTIRRQVAAAFRRVRDDAWDAAAAGGIAELRDLGDRYAAGGRRADAATVFTTLVAETLERYHHWEDREGELGSEIIECDLALASMLDAEASPPTADRLPPEIRAQVIKALVDIWRTDVDLGSVDLSQEGTAPIAARVTDEERATVETWLRAEPPAEESEFARDWRDRCTIGFRLMLKEQAGLTDEELLEEQRQAEARQDVAHTLIRLARVDEAVNAARRLREPRPLIQIAGDFVTLGGPHVELGRALVEDKLREREGKNLVYDDTLRAWLVQQYTAHDLPDKALQIERRSLAKQPSLATYDAVAQVARHPGPAVRSLAPTSGRDARRVAGSQGLGQPDQYPLQ